MLASVRIQNQTGPHPTKWDKTGMVVEVRQFDQYVVRVDGSGRTTLRNRKFLRTYMPVIPRTPILMAPGHTPMLPTPSSTCTERFTPTASLPKTPPQPSFSVQPPSDIPCRPTANPQSPATPVSSPLLQLPPRSNLEPTNQTLPTTPKAAHSNTNFTGVPRALRALMPHNAPGLKEQTTPPQTDIMPGAPRRSTRLAKLPHQIDTDYFKA